ncbi:hypothetical protein BH10ACI4_BH10ACI4_38910 [soil metagenome]
MPPAFEGNDLYFGQGAEGSDRAVSLPAHHRDQHLYVCGAPRTGKSKFLEHLIRQDLRNRWKTGCGLLLIDWHGRLYDDLLRWLAWEDLEIEEPVLLIDLRRDEDIVSYNLLRQRGPGAYPSVVVNTLVKDTAYVWGQSGTDQTPRFARIMNLILRILYLHQLSFMDSSHLITRNITALKRAMTEQVEDTELRDEWRFLNSLRPEKLNELLESTVNRLWRFNQNPLMRSMFGQSGVSLDLRAALAKGHIILVSLARGKGKADEEDAETMATLLLSDLWTAAQERGKSGDRAGSGPQPFYVYLDEFQRFVTPTLAENLDEAGGFGLHMTMAHQYPTQLLDRGEAGTRVYNSVMANASTKVVLRTAHQGDLEPLARQLFTGVMDPDQIKLILEATRVLDYDEETRLVQSNIEGGSAGTTSPIDPPEDSNALSHESSGSNWSHVTTEQTSLRPRMGTEISSVQFRSLEEQLHLAMAKINTLKRRQCLARMAESDRPVAFTTPEVSDAFDEPDRIEKYRRETLAKWPFVLSIEEAKRRLSIRSTELEQRFLAPVHDPDDGPEAFRTPMD